MGCPHENYEILKQRGRQVTAKCLDCDDIFIYTLEKDIGVTVIINRREHSLKSRVSLAMDRVVRVGDVIDVQGEDVEVHSIEVGNKRVDSEKATSITSLWGVSLTYPMVIGVSVHFPNDTRAFKVVVDRKDLFKIGDILQIGKFSFEVSTIMTTSGKRKTAQGVEIKRIFGKPSNRLATKLLEVYDVT